MNLHEQPAKPISFSPAMVEAIQSGRKSQTRRLIKNELDNRGLRYCHPKTGWEDWHGRPVVCPFGRRPGNLLWVREEHRIWGTRASGELAKIHCEYKDGTINTKWVTDMPLNTAQRIAARKTLGLWQRARFLPRYFARTYLKVTGIQAERLQDISEDDSKAEGVEKEFDTWRDYGDPVKEGSFTCETARESFRTLWEKINGPGSWEASPWVWVVKFEKI